MVSAVYFLTFAAALAILLSMLFRHRRTVSSVVLLSILVTVSTFGLYLLSVSRTLEMGLLANGLVCLGACFCPLCVVKILGDGGQVKIPGWIWGVFGTGSTLVLLLIFTGGRSRIYYKSVSMAFIHGFHFLERQFGPAHILYPLLMAGYAAVILWLLYTVIRRHRELPFGSRRLFLVLVAGIGILYLVQNVLDLKVNIVFFGYFLAMVMLMHRAEYINRYDLAVNIAGSIQAMNEIAYLEFDTRYRCMGWNSRLEQMFPEVRQVCPMGRKPRQGSSPLYEKVICWVYTRKPGETGALYYQQRYYEMTVRDIPYRRSACVGYLLEVVDRTAEHLLTESLQTYNEQLRRDVEKQTAHISYMKDMLVVGLASMIESRDDSTGGHIKRTYQVMRTFARKLMDHRQELGITQEFLEMVTKAAPMHDLGKIAIDDAVLKKQGRYTDDDYEIMKRHPEEGARVIHQILAGVESPEFVTVAVNVARCHHERWDGKGYPQGLRGTDIPLEGRLMALPDVCDAMLSKRCYKEAWSFDRVFTIIEENLGTQFDPVLGRIFISCRPEIERMYKQWYEEDRDSRKLELQPMGEKPRKYRKK